MDPAGTGQPGRAAPGAVDAAATPWWRRGATRRLLGVLVLLAVAGGVGDTASPVLIVHTPLLLVALNPRARNVLLASRSVGAPPLVVVALIRRLVGVPVFYRLGRIHGDASLAWFEGRFPRSGRWARWVERRFDRAAAPVVFLLPGALTAYLAGSTGMHEALVLLLSALGIAVRLAALLAAGVALSGVLSGLLAFIAAHQVPLLAISIAVSAVYALRYRRVLRRRVPVPVELAGRVVAPVAPRPDRHSAESSRTS